jgi:hypothetical protein
VSTSRESPPPDLPIGATLTDAFAVYTYVARMVCYVDRRGFAKTYPKCADCGLPGRTIEKCDPLINYCLAQALAAQHPDVVKRIKASYKQFLDHARSWMPHDATVKQLVAYLDIPDFDQLADPVDSINQLNTVTCLDLTDPNMCHCQASSSLVSFHD